MMNETEPASYILTRKGFAAVATGARDGATGAHGYLFGREDAHPAQ